MLELIIANLLLLCLIVVIVHDIAWFRIPNVVVGAILVLFVAEAVRAFDLLPAVMHFGAGLIALAVGIGAYAFRVFGGGDAKLLAVTGLWAGLGHLTGHFLMIALMGGVMALGLVVARQLLFMALVSAQRQEIRLPRVLIPGEAIPYGVPIALSMILIRAGEDPFSAMVAKVFSRVF